MFIDNLSLKRGSRKMEKDSCAVCGKERSLTWMSGVSICALCFPDVNDEVNRLLRAGKQASTARIARDMRRRKEGIKPDLTRTQLEKLRQYIDCQTKSEDGWDQVLGAFGF
jgi:hypothetical protein